ncbi:MAG: DMT family transporter [Pseudomonadota bacterium]
MSDRSRPIVAALWMLGAVVSFTTMAVAGREIGGVHTTFEILLFRSLVGILIVSVIGAALGRLNEVRTKRLGLHGVRNVCHFTAQNLWFYALTVLPLANVLALEFTTPLWIALLSPLFLGERMTRARVFAAGLGFLGILIIVRPGTVAIGPGVLAGAASAIFFAGTYMATKGLARSETTLSILFWLTVIQAGLGAVTVAAFGSVTWPTWGTLPYLLLIAVCGLAGHFFITNALHHAPTSVVAPFDFLRLPLAAVVGLILYDEPLVATFILGAALVLSANAVNIRAEQARARV